MEICSLGHSSSDCVLCILYLLRLFFFSRFTIKKIQSDEEKEEEEEDLVEYDFVETFFLLLFSRAE